MLSAILAKSECAACKFCCSFRRTSLWETPIFPAADLSKFKALKPEVSFRPAGSSGQSYSFDLSACYKSSDAAEEAPCPFLDNSRGCTLPQELKPFDCKIWPLRAVSQPDGSIVVGLTPTCQAINKIPLEKVRELAASGLGQEILDYAASHPDIIKTSDCTDYITVFKN